MSDQIKEILGHYRESVESFRTELRHAGMPESQIVVETINLPDLDRMIPEDTIRFYRDIKKLVILHWGKLGWPVREIVRTMGGGREQYVTKLLRENGLKVSPAEEDSE